MYIKTYEGCPEHRYRQLLHYWHKLTMVLQLTIMSMILCDEIPLFGINGTIFLVEGFFQTRSCNQMKREFFLLGYIGY